MVGWEKKIILLLLLLSYYNILLFLTIHHVIQRTLTSAWFFGEKIRECQVSDRRTITSCVTLLHGLAGPLNDRFEFRQLLCVIRKNLGLFRTLHNSNSRSRVSCFEIDLLWSICWIDSGNNTTSENRSERTCTRAAKKSKQRRETKKTYFFGYR